MTDLTSAQTSKVCSRWHWGGTGVALGGGDWKASEAGEMLPPHSFPAYPLPAAGFTKLASYCSVFEYYSITVLLLGFSSKKEDSPDV